MTEKDIQSVLAFVRFNLGCEDIELTEKDIENSRAVLLGEITGDEAVKRILRKNGHKN